MRFPELCAGTQNPQNFSKHFPKFLQSACLHLLKPNQDHMKKTILFSAVIVFAATYAFAQDLKSKDVPTVVKAALAKKYPKATKVSWEKEKGNYEANWGGKSGEDNSVQFTPAGDFVEEVNAISVSQLPPAVSTYVKANYKGAKIREAGKVTDAKGQKMFEAEIKGKDLIFDEKGDFIKVD